MASTSRVAAAVLVALLPGAAIADWPSNPTTNLPICTAPNLQLIPAIATDMAGGAYIAWQDARVSTSDANIYAQHVLSTGVLDPAWPLDGLLVCGATGNQLLTQVVPDGTGGVLVAWNDVRSGSNDIYAHHVLANGTVDPVWPTDGLAVCTAAGSQSGVKMVGDGAGGALLAWRDLRNDTDLFAMRVLADGVVDPTWPVNGLAFASGVGAQQFRSITPMVSDGHGGFFATWQDTRNGPAPDVYAQHLFVNGAVAPGWPANGLAVCTATNIQEFPIITTDRAGGAFVGWEDLRGGVALDIYAQHVKANGTVDPAWPTDGSAVCTAFGNQSRAAVIADATGGVCVAWVDARAGSIPALYAQHLLGSGTLDPTWPAGDLAFNPNFGSHISLVLLADGTGGALAVWDDARSGLDVYAQHILVTGTTDPAWPLGGRAISNATGIQNAGGAVIPDGSGGWIAAWSDTRAGGSNDIYAQRVQANGQLGGTVLDVPRTAATTVSLESARPNPARVEDLRILFSGAAAPGTSLELLDVAGRLVASRELSALGAGSHEMRFDDLPALKPGLYFVALKTPGDARSARILRVAVIR
jgi:hypothetical protein